MIKKAEFKGYANVAATTFS